MIVTATGSVGIGTMSPGQKLEVSGNVLATSYMTSSDKNLKENILPLPDALAKVLSIRGYSFNWKKDGREDVGIIAQEVEAEWLAIKDGALALEPAVVADIAARFRYPDYEKLADDPPEVAALRRTDPRFAAWLGNSVANHKVAGYAIVTLSLKPEGGPPGDATAEQMDVVADLADRFSFGEIRVGHEQNLVLPHVAQRDLPEIWRALDRDGLATPNVGLVSDIIACPGLDYCSLATARSIPVAQRISDRFGDGDPSVRLIFRTPDGLGRTLTGALAAEPPPELRQPPGSSRGPTQAALEL